MPLRTQVSYVPAYCNWPASPEEMNLTIKQMAPTTISLFPGGSSGPDLVFSHLNYPLQCPTMLYSNGLATGDSFI